MIFSENRLPLFRIMLWIPAGRTTLLIAEAAPRRAALFDDERVKSL
jgi:hypothetical protein